MQLENLFELIRTETKENGVIIETYKPKDQFDIFVDAIDIETGLIRKCRVEFMTKHIGIKMYKVEMTQLDFTDEQNEILSKTIRNNLPKKLKKQNALTYASIFDIENFDTFYASEDHGLLIYDAEEDKIKIMSPLEVIQLQNEKQLKITRPENIFSITGRKLGGDPDLLRYFFIKKTKLYNAPYYNSKSKLAQKDSQKKTSIRDRLMKFCSLIPIEFVTVTETDEYNYGYDFTVEGFKTFMLADGLFVMDTMVVYSILYTQHAAEKGKTEYHYVMPRYSYDIAWPIEYDSLLGWYLFDTIMKEN